MYSDEANTFTLHQHSLIASIAGCQSFLNELKSFHKMRWPLLYPKEDSTFVVLKLLLKAPTLRESHFLANLEDNSISKLLESKLSEISGHLDRLTGRIVDTTSKILVTGDLNAGKSTFINSLLQTELLPSDQQPCTMSFCEILDAGNNGNIEQVHSTFDILKYNKLDQSTFQVHSFEQLKDYVTNDEDKEKWFKIYCNCSRKDGISLLHNPAIDLTLIDAPGLNSDSIKTMSVFARQEDIDVIVFVINAANHLTLSAREFLQTAGKEKSLMFIIVNKFDDIKNKEKCKRMIMSQIQQVLPSTFENSDELIHFISAKEHLDFVQGHLDAPCLEDEFVNMEKCLSLFALEKRIISKLLPVKNYLGNIIRDFEILVDHNLSSSMAKLELVISELEQTNPIYEKMNRIQDKFITDLQKSADQTCEAISAYSEKHLKDFIDNMEYLIDEIPWKGFWGTFSYLDEAVSHVEYRTELEVKAVRYFVVDTTISGIHNMYSMAACNVWEIFNKTPDIKHLSQNIEFPKIEKLNPAISKWKLFTINLYGFNSAGMMSFFGIVGVVSGTLLGYSKMIGVAWKVLKFIPFISVKSTLLLCGASIIGALAYSIMDLKRIVQSNLKKKIQVHFDQTSWISIQSEACVGASRRALKIPLWDLQKQYHQALHNQEKIRFEKERNKVVAEESVTFFKDKKKKLVSIKSQVEQIDLEIQ